MLVHCKLLFYSCLRWLFLILIGQLVSYGQGVNNIVSKSGAYISPNLLFERFYTSDGLPEDRIRSIFQDSRGFLWVGTMNGICRYDGYEFKKYHRNKQEAHLAGNWATSICEDANQNIWIGTKEGLTRFDTKQETFTSFKNEKNNPKSLFHNLINTLQFDRFGKLWIGSSRGLAVFDPIDKTFRTIDTAPLNTSIGKIIPSAGDFLWITTDIGIVRYHVPSGKFTVFKLSVRPNAYGERFWSMLEEDKDLYVTTGGNGLFKLPFNKAGNKYGDFEAINQYAGYSGSLDHTQIFDICKSKDGYCWLATERGLAKVERIESPGRTISFYKKNELSNQSISNDMVYKVFIDRTNVLWCGTDQGLNKLDLYLNPFRYYTFTDIQSKGQVRGIYSKNDSDVWFGTNNGFYVYDYNSGITKSFQISNETSFFNSNRSLFTEDEQIWLGTLGGVLKYDLKTGRSDVAIEGRTIFAMLKDRNSNMWIGTNNGLFKITREGKKINYLSNLPSLSKLGPWYVRSLYEDHAGYIWVGMENGGIGRFNPHTEEFIQVKSDSKQEITGNNIVSIIEYPNNTFWAGSESGLNKIVLNDTDLTRHQYQIKNYFEENGLPDKSVKGLIADGRGSIWVSTGKGLARFTIKDESFQRFLTRTSFSASSCQKITDHQFLFGTADGFVKFDPADIVMNQALPKVLITDLNLFNKAVNIRDTVNGDIILNQEISSVSAIKLNHQNNVFSIGFTGLHFSNPQENRYAYKMDGFDQDWIYCNAQNRSATYTNLDAGNYRFMVKAANNSGKWTDAPAILNITVLPPLWKTWWAWTIYVLLFVTAIIVFLRYSHKQSLQRHQLLFEKREKEQLKLLSQMKVKFFTDVAHEFRTPLSLIVGPVEDMLNTGDARPGMKYKIQLVYRNCKKLMYLIEELMTFQKLEQGMLKLKPAQADMVDFVKDIYDNFMPYAEKKEINFTFLSNEEHLALSFDPGKMEMILNNLIFNAFKFTRPGDSINISVKDYPDGLPASLKGDPAIKHWLGISVEDNGTGISKEEFKHLFERFFSEGSVKGTGVGLSLTKSLIELHKGVIQAESVPDVRTRFDVYLPVLQSEQKMNVPAGNINAVYKPEFDMSVYTSDAGVPPVADLISNQDEIVHSILIVEDDAELRDYLSLIFKGQYHVKTAVDGLKAMEIIREHEPTMIISDLMMPGMDGMALCSAIKNDVNTSHIPFILLTAKSTDDNKMDGLKIGADDYIVKPFNPSMLRLKVQNLIETQKHLIEKYQNTGIIIPKNVTRNPLDEALMENVLAYINKHLSEEELSVEALGSAVNMSRSNLFRKVKAITGQTPVELIYHVRLMRGMELLLERKLSVSEIAYEVGFTYPSSFTKSFKKKFGKSPSDYLNDVLENSKG